MEAILGAIVAVGIFVAGVFMEEWRQRGADARALQRVRRERTEAAALQLFHATRELLAALSDRVGLPAASDAWAVTCMSSLLDIPPEVQLAGAIESTTYALGAFTPQTLREVPPEMRERAMWLCTTLMHDIRMFRAGRDAISSLYPPRENARDWMLGVAPSQT